MKNKQEEQFTIIPHSLMGSKDLTDQDKLTLGIILSFINNGKECYIGNDTLGEMLGITKNAASIRINRLEKIGCVALRYTYKEGKKLVDKKIYYPIVYHTTGIVCETTGIVPQTKRYRLTDKGVSSHRRRGVVQRWRYYTTLLHKCIKQFRRQLTTQGITQGKSC